MLIYACLYLYIYTGVVYYRLCLYNIYIIKQIYRTFVMLSFASISYLLRFVPCSSQFKLLQLAGKGSLLNLPTDLRNGLIIRTQMTEDTIDDSIMFTLMP
jgi:hypothetical protein